MLHTEQDTEDGNQQSLAPILMECQVSAFLPGPPAHSWGLVSGMSWNLSKSSLIKGMRLEPSTETECDCSKRCLRAGKDAPGCRSRGGVVRGWGHFRKSDRKLLESRGDGRGLQGSWSPAGLDAQAPWQMTPRSSDSSRGGWFSHSQLSLLESVSIAEAKPDLEAPRWPWLSLRGTRGLVAQPSFGPASCLDGASPGALTSRSHFSVTCSVLRCNREQCTHSSGSRKKPLKCRAG